MTSASDVITRWVDVITGKKTRSISSSNVFFEGDLIYSYGHHFELARILRDKTGKPSHFLVNGDTYSVTTSNHQSDLRGAISRSGIPSVIIPHRALNAAGITLSSVTVIEVTADGHEKIIDNSAELPSGAEWRNIQVIDKYEEFEDRRLMGPVPNQSWLETLGTVRVVTKPAVTHMEMQLINTRSSHGGRSKWEQGIDGSYSRTRYRHWLGESLVSGEIAYWDRKTGDRKRRRALYLSGFDSNETRPSYFFCELPPRAKPTTVADAYESLKPQTVRFAETQGRTVHRQGDIYSVPAPTLTKRDLAKQGATFSKGAYILLTNHRGTEVAVLPNGMTLVRGTLTHAPAGRTPDHKRVTVGKSWHIALKNLVPVSA